ncbi:MAG: PQQ-binding-like beta-propeller repeat protein [bacterium]
MKIPRLPVFSLASIMDVRRFFADLISAFNRFLYGLKRKLAGGHYTKKQEVEEIPQILPNKTVEKSLAWVFACDEEVKQILSADENLLVGCKRKVYLLDRKTGDIEMEYELDTPLTGVAFNAGNFFLFLKDEVICFSPNFSPRWKRALRCDDYLIDDYRVFLHDSFTHRICCLSRFDGEEIWSKRPILFFNFYDWAQDRDNIYIFGGRWVQALSKEDGHQIWRYDRGDWSITKGACGEDVLYVYDCFYDFLFCLDKEGKKLWEYFFRRLGFDFIDRPIGQEGSLKASLLPLGKGVFVAAGGEVCLLRDNGEVIWHTRRNLELARMPFPQYSPVFYNKGEKFLYFMVNMYVEDWEVYRVRISNGEMDKILESPFLSSINADERCLYLGTRNGGVYALYKVAL